MRQLLSIALVFLAVLSAGAAVTDLKFRHYRVGEGLTSDCVRDVVQDDRGFMWIATDGGLLRFDGTRFRRFDLACGAVRGREDNFVSTLHVRDGRLFAGTDSHLFVYDEKNERFPEVPLDSLIGHGAPSRANVRAIGSDRSGNIWVSLADAGLVRLSSDLSAARLIPCPQIANFVSDILVDSRNNVWVTSTQGDGGIYRVDTERNALDRLKLLVDGREFDPHALVLCEDQNHVLWAGLWNGGLLRFDAARGTAVRFGLGGDVRHIHSVTSYSPTELIVGSDCGLCIFDIPSGSHRCYDNDELNPASLSNRFVYPVFKDKEGGIWVGTFYGGLNYLPPQLKNFNTFTHSRFANSVGGSIISCFCEDGDGAVWIGSDDGGLCRFDRTSRQFSHVALAASGLADNVHALCKDGNRLWIGTYSSGVGVLDPATGRIRRYDHSGTDVHSLDNSSSYAILRDSKGNIWVGTMMGLNKYNRAEDSFDRVCHTGALISDIKEDAHGNLWLTTQGRGLWCYNPESGEIRNFRYSAGEGALPHNHVSCVAFDGNKTMWLATGKGLCSFRPETETFELVKDVLNTSVVLGIVPDRGDLWLTTGNGLVKYNPGSGTAESYTQFDGIAADEFLTNAVLKTSDGEIYVGTPSGFSSFYPYQILPNRIRPSLAFTGLDVINSEVSVGDRRMKQSLNHTDAVELSHDDYMFTVYFAALSYVNPGKNHVAYMLEGFDREWNEGDGDMKATYTNLSPGTYRLWVIASNSDGLWNEDGIALTINVRPAWYASVPMKIAYFLLVIGAVFLIFKTITVRNSRRHAEELQRISDNKEKEVFHAKLNFFTMIAHEIRTPVSLIIGPLEKIMASSESLPPAVNKSLEVIDRNGQRLLFLVNQLLDFKKVEQNGLQPHFRPHDIAGLIAAVAERFAPSVEQRGGRLNVNYPPAGFEADVDAEEFTKMLSNLLNNARKFMKDEVTLTCEPHPDQGVFTIAVADNGLGIGKDDQQKIFRPFYQVASAESDSKGGTGLGLSIVASMVEAHGGEIKVDSALGHGAKFIVTLPIRQKLSPEDAAPEEEEEIPGEAALEEMPGVPSKPVMLVADDNEDMLSFISENFSNSYEVLTAINGEDAWNKLLHNKVEFIICDWMMPVLDGVQLCRRVRSNPSVSHIPFILLTAKTDNFSKIEGMKCGADAYVEKPFSVNYLEARINNLLSMRSLLKEKFSRTPLEPITTLASEGSVDSDFLRRLTELIEDNFTNPGLSVDFLASEMGISRSSLYAKIRTLADVTPNELIQITRLKKAAKLLSERRYKVNEICFMVGFNSSSYFAKCFQKQFGMKPAEFAASEG